MLHAMARQPSNYGVGRTGAGEGHGMAVLEGLVATLEVRRWIYNSFIASNIASHNLKLFDALKDSAQVYMTQTLHTINKGLPTRTECCHA